MVYLIRSYLILLVCLHVSCRPDFILFHLISSYFMLLSYVGQGQGTIRTTFEKSKATDSAPFCAILCEALRVPCEEARFWERSIPGVRNAGPLRVRCGSGVAGCSMVLGRSRVAGAPCGGQNLRSLQRAEMLRCWQWRCSTCSTAWVFRKVTCV